MDEATAGFVSWLLREEGLPGGVREALPAEQHPGYRCRVRFQAGPRSWYDLRITGDGRELQVGFTTEDRNVNEEIEDSILSRGGDLDELLGDELCDLGEDPLPMAHFFERPCFRYTCRLPLGSESLLESPELRGRVFRILKACRILFGDTAGGGGT